MARPPLPEDSANGQPRESLERLSRPLTLGAQVERILRKAIADGRYPAGQLPTEVELAEQLGVSRETVRLAAEVLQQEGLLVKIRRKGTFTQIPSISLEESKSNSTVLTYLQAAYPGNHGADETVVSTINSLMLQGSVSEAGDSGRELLVRRASHIEMRTAFLTLQKKARMGGIIFASFGEEKLIKRVTGLGLPTVLLDHDLHLPQVSSVREDSFAAGKLAVQHLYSHGHRKIAIVYWERTDLNPWRLDGFRQGLREAGLTRRRHWEFPVELTETGAARAADDWLKLSPRPTAIYCFNNSLALRMIHILRGRGIDVPNDVSVMGGGGDEVDGLTCHQADWYQMGRRAVQILVTLQESPGTQEPVHHLFPHTLRHGMTTATVH